MANNLYLRRNLSEGNPPLSLVVARNHTTRTDSTVGVLYWRWENDENMPLQYFGETKAGTDFRVPFELKGREVRVYVAGRTKKGVMSVTDIKNAPSKVFSPDKVAETHEASKTKIASENLFAGAMVNVWDDGGIAKGRLASANGMEAHAFVMQAVTSGAIFIPNVTGMNTAMTGLTPGAKLYLSNTPGQVTEIFPTGGLIRQRVGTSLSDSAMSFEPDLISNDGEIRPLFDHTNKLSTQTTARETLYSDPIAMGTLATDKDKITAEYHVRTDPNANNKRLFISFAGTDIIDTGNFTANDKEVEIEVSIIRVLNTAVRISAEVLIDGVTAILNVADIGSLNLTTTGYSLKIDATTPDAAGDIEVLFAFGVFIPAAAETYYVLFNDDFVTFNGVPLTFTP